MPEMAPNASGSDAGPTPRPPAAHVSSLACLRGGKTYVPCNACAESCPVGAIGFIGRSAAIAESCLACGACSAACPTGAVTVDGFGDPPAVGAHLNIECARIPARQLETESWVVPCVAGLRVSDIVAAGERQGDVSIALVDRGLCEQCPASRGSNIVADVHARFSMLLDRVAPGLIRLDRLQLPLTPEEVRPAGLRPAPTRRAFLRSLIAPEPRAPRRTGALEDRAALVRLATAAGTTPSLYPTVTLSPMCRDHGVCAASCPANALRRERLGEADHIRRLAFDAAQCVACGRCAEVCPEQALTFMAVGAMPMPLEPQILRETRLPICPQCDEAFVADDQDNVHCPACRKSQSLFADLLAAIRGPARRPGADISDGRV